MPPQGNERDKTRHRVDVLFDAGRNCYLVVRPEDRRIVDANRRARSLFGDALGIGVTIIDELFAGPNAERVARLMSTICDEGHDHARVDDVELATRLLEEARVAAVPGSAFGAPGHLRLSYATSMEAIDAGLDRLEEAIGRL